MTNWVSEQEAQQAPGAVEAMAPAAIGFVGGFLIPVARKLIWKNGNEVDSVQMNARAVYWESSR